MQISVKRTGGFAGLIEELANVNSADLNPDAAQQVEQLVQSSGFFDLPDVVARDIVGADMFRYEITITEGDQQRTVAFYEDGSSDTEPLRQIVEALTQMP